MPYHSRIEHSQDAARDLRRFCTGNSRYTPYIPLLRVTKLVKYFLLHTRKCVVFFFFTVFREHLQPSRCQDWATDWTVRLSNSCSKHFLFSQKHPACLWVPTSFLWSGHTGVLSQKYSWWSETLTIYLYEGRTESHEQLFFAYELGTADEGECGRR